MKINASIVHKVGLPDYSSISVGLGIETELEPDASLEVMVKNSFDRIGKYIKEEQQKLGINAGIGGKSATAGSQNTKGRPPIPARGETDDWWKSVEIHTRGKNQGKTLGELPEGSLRWYQENFQAEYQGKTSEKAANLRRALNASMAAKAQIAHESAPKTDWGGDDLDYGSGSGKAGTATENQIRAIYAIISKLWPDERDHRKTWIAENATNNRASSIEELDKEEASTAIDYLHGIEEMRQTEKRDEQQHGDTYHAEGTVGNVPF